MRVVGTEKPRKQRAPMPWSEIAEFLRSHPGQWVEVGEDISKTIAYNINHGKGPRALAGDPTHDYEAYAFDVIQETGRCTLLIRATKKED